MPNTYRYRDGYWGPKTVPAEDVALEIQQVQSTGPLTASRLVERAAHSDSPLNPLFPWDDAEAGNKYRLMLARTLIRAIVVISVPDNETSSASVSPMVIHVPKAGGGEGTYVSPEILVQHPDDFERALGEAQRDLRSAERRFEELRRLAMARGGAVEALAIASQGFNAVREALQLLRTA